MPLHPVVASVTQRIIERSRGSRAAYLARTASATSREPRRRRLSCGNLAHGFAACGAEDKAALKSGDRPNIAIVTAYNDMLSAHMPYARFPDLIKTAAQSAGATAQVAGGVPAMCDGITQGRTGMELSLFSRDVIALSTAVALSHDMFDAALYLGICDKIVPGLLIGALSFGHLPAIFVPSGPMASGLPNEEKAKVRQRHAAGEATRAELLEAESRSYHSAGTCTFYGTANSNQMLMEVMGLHLPGASFVSPDTPLRDALTVAATRRVAEITALGSQFLPVSKVVDEKAIVNGVVGLNATGGSTNHLLHLVAIADAAGIDLRWEDFDELSGVVPLLTRIYPNGVADVNQFHAAGGMEFLIGELLDAGLLHGDIHTVWGTGLSDYRSRPALDGSGQLQWSGPSRQSANASVLRPVANPFSASGGLKLLRGNLGDAVIKISAVPANRQVIEAPAIVFDRQEDLQAAFDRGELDRDFVAVIRFQGPKANGMPELHKLTPLLGLLQERGRRVALITDGRMSGASGKVPAAIHLSPEAAVGGPIGKLRNGDLIRLDAIAGELVVQMDADAWNARAATPLDPALSDFGLGRNLFALFRSAVGPAQRGASVFGDST